MPSWFRRGSRDARAVVSIPVQYRLAMIYQVYYAGAAAPPDPAELFRSSAAWRDEHVGRTGGMSELWHDNFFNLKVMPVEELPFQPPVAVLRRTGLGEMEERVMNAASHGVFVGCGDYNTPPRLGLWSALAMALAVAELLDGVVLDPDARRVLDRNLASGWFNDLRLIAASQHVIVPFSVGHERGLGLMTTCGMEKFGLPNLMLPDVPPHLDAMGHVVTAVGQLLIENVLRMAYERKAEIESIDVPREIALDRALFQRAQGGGLGGLDPDSRPLIHVGLLFGPGERAQDPPMIRLVPPTGEPEPGVWMQSAVRALAKETTDEVREVRRSEGDAMQRAHERAMAELADVKHRFVDGLAPGEVLFVKHGFQTPSGDTEWMWIVVSEWASGRVVGQLVNTPQDVPSLKEGSTVTVDEDALYDWMLARRGGSVEGAYTDQVLREQEPG